MHCQNLFLWQVVFDLKNENFEKKLALMRRVACFYYVIIIIIIISKVRTDIRLES